MEARLPSAAKASCSIPFFSGCAGASAVTCGQRVLEVAPDAADMVKVSAPAAGSACARKCSEAPSSDICATSGRPSVP